jgi:D-alanyl-D-alanine carboxypeptidase
MVSLSSPVSLASVEHRLDEVISQAIGAGRLIGLSLSVVMDGEIALLKQYGLASREEHIPVTRKSRFCIASVSKQLTATCVLLLQEEGKLSVDDPVCKYFPDLSRAATITIRDLLNHVAGYPDYYPMDYVDSRLNRETTPDEVRKTYGTVGLEFEPGEKFSYCNTGYLILGMIVERVSGKTLFGFLSERVFQPLGMTNTQNYQNEGPRLVRRYTSYYGGEPELAKVEGQGWLFGAGSLISTPEDVAKWQIALMSGKILEPDSLRQMTSHRTLNSGAESDHGFGLYVVNARGQRVWFHDGEVAGAITGSVMLPDLNRAYVWTCNFDRAEVQPIAAVLMDAIVPPDPLEKRGAGHSAPRRSPPNFEAEEVAARLYNEMRSGKVDRRQLSPELNELLSPERLREIAGRIGRWGQVKQVVLEAEGVRSGMETTHFRFELEREAPRISMFRRPDGKIAQFLF